MPVENPAEARPGKLLSIIVHGKNDAYMGNFLWRLSACLNKHARNLTELGARDSAEIVLVDWGSEVPLAGALALEKAAQELTRFIQVPPAVAAKYNRDSPYSSAHAINTAARRVQGQFILLCDSDSYLPLASTAQILDGIRNGRIGGCSLAETFFLGSRFHVPKAFHAQAPSLETLDAYIQENQRMFAHDKMNFRFFGGAQSSFLCATRIWHECTGIDEKLIYVGWCDIDLFIRLASTYRYADLEDLGVLTFHLEHFHGVEDRSTRREIPRKINENVVPHCYAPNGLDWGLRNEPFTMGTTHSEGAARFEVPPRSTPADAAIYYDLQKVARHLYWVWILIERDPEYRDRMAATTAGLRQIQERVRDLLEDWWSYRQRLSEPAVREALHGAHRQAHRFIAETFQNETFKKIWQRKDTVQGDLCVRN